MNKSDVRRLVRRLLATTLKRLSDGSGSPLDSALRREADCLMAPASCFAAALHCGPLVVEEPLRNGDRVVVAKGCDEGQHGAVCDALDGAEHTILYVRFDDGGFRLRSREYLRHEREDERPAEEPEPPPVRMTVALVDGRIKVSLDPAEGAK